MRIVLAITTKATALHVGALERRDAKVVSGFSRNDEVSRRREELAKCLYGKSASSAQSADQKSAGCCPQIAQMTQISAQPIASTARSLGTTARRLKWWTTFAPVARQSVPILAASRSLLAKPSLLVRQSGPMAGQSYLMPAQSSPVSAQSGARVGQLIPVVRQSELVVGESASIARESGHVVGQSGPIVRLQRLWNASKPLKFQPLRLFCHFCPLTAHAHCSL